MRIEAGGIADTQKIENPTWRRIRSSVSLKIAVAVISAAVIYSLAYQAGVLSGK